MRLGSRGFLGIAVLFHLIYIYSIFDIYFVSPISHGMQAYRVKGDAPAKRLVLYVGMLTLTSIARHCADAIIQATVFALTRLSRSTLIPPLTPIPRHPKSRAISRPFYGHEYSIMAHSVSLTHGYLQNLVLVMLPSSPGCMRTSPQSPRAGS